MNNKRLTEEERNSVYNSISKRGLVKACNEFDSENKNAMKKFVEEKQLTDPFEPARIAEKVIDVADMVGESVSAIVDSSIPTTIVGIVSDIKEKFPKKNKAENNTENTDGLTVTIF